MEDLSGPPSGVTYPGGVDSQYKLVHSIVATAANVHDSKVLPDLLHGKETRVDGDSEYLGKGDVIRQKSPQARVSSTSVLTAIVR